jgi:hypothetical protein
MSEDTLAALAGIARAHDLAGQPAALLQAVDRAAAALVGHRLFTVLAYGHGSRDACRIYTSMPGAYPVSGRKAIQESAWSRQVLERGEPYIGRNAQDLREVFPDHALIGSLGCASVLNQPVRWQGVTLGTLNLLHQAGWYHDRHVAIARVLAQLALPALMAPAPTTPAPETP